MEVGVTILDVLFLVVLGAVCGTAAWRGGQDERLAAGAIAAAAFLSPFVSARGFVKLGVVLVDIGLLIVLGAVALRSRSFWPIWATGFQLCTLAGHFAAAKSSVMVPAAYAETLAIWSYAVMASLLVGTLVEAQRHHGRG
jgi:hypothetical protein